MKKHKRRLSVTETKGGNNPWFKVSEGTSIFDGALTFLYLGEVLQLTSGQEFFRMHIEGFTSNLLWSFRCSNVGQLVLTRGSEARGSATELIKAEVPYLIAVTKEKGANVANWHIYNFTTKTWLHEAGVTPFAATEGSAGGTNRFIELAHDCGAIDAIACWNRKLSNAELEALVTVKFIEEWLTTSPNGLWIFDQATKAEPIVDETGHGAEQVEELGETLFIEPAPLIPRAKKVGILKNGVQLEAKRWVMRNGLLVNG